LSLTFNFKDFIMTLFSGFSFSKAFPKASTPSVSTSTLRRISPKLSGLPSNAGRKACPLQSQQGYTNIQLAIGVLVSVVAVLGAIGGFTYVTQAKVNNQLTYLADLKNSTGRLFLQLGAATASASSLANLNSYGFFPSSTVSGTGATTAVTNQWGGAITVGVGTAGVAGDSIAYTFTGIPNDVCVAIGLGVDAIADVVTINGASTKAYGGNTNPTTVVGNTACSKTVTGGHTFVFTIKG